MQRPLVLIFTAIRPDGTPHVTPIWYEYDRSTFYCWVGAETVKVGHVRANPNVGLCIATHDEPYQYVLAEGTCDVVTEGVEARARSIARRYYGEGRGDRFAEENLASSAGVLLVVTPTRMVTESAA